MLFLVLRFLTHHFGALKHPGVVAGVFLAGYGIARSIAEFFREPHFHGSDRSRRDSSIRCR